MAESLDAWRKARRNLLEIEGPGATCGHCGHASAVKGAWSVEDGRLVFRADPNPLRGRGPDFVSCCESSEIAEFTRITVDGTELTAEQVGQLQAAQRAAEEAQWAQWANEQT